MNNLEKIKAKKSLGQNFLTDIETLHAISDFYDIQGKNIVEVWPWYGALTEFLLAKKPKGLSLVELDPDMIKILEERVEKWELNAEKLQFEINHMDVLKYTPPFSNGDYLVIANIPYYITSPILKHFLYDVSNKPSNMLILMQKEVGERILEWEHGNKRGIIKTSVLSLIVAKKAKVKKVIDVPSHFFRPAPKVDSIVISFETTKNYESLDDTTFLEFVKKAFAEPRKKLISNLKKAWFVPEKIKQFFEENTIDENVRPEDLSIEDYMKLITILKRDEL